MRFALIAFDYTDSEAPARRKEVRPRHKEVQKEFKAAGTLKYCGGLLNNEGTTIGSLMLHDYPSEEALRADFLAREPYALEDVWETIHIYPHVPADPLFTDVL
ncbi:MAG: YciI family protein [Oscillospiraceae bacterium]|nr:YciI family protein [Oscillospiraceae bacterium]